MITRAKTGPTFGRNLHSWAVAVACIIRARDLQDRQPILEA